ncbi:hypothetical protein N9191_01935 [bacterium]|nr:hypothetical protein [bacterium]
MKNVRVFLAAIMALFLCAPVFADEKFKDTLKKAEQGDAALISVVMSWI